MYTSYIANKDRKNIADFMEKMGDKGFLFSADNIALSMGKNPAFPRECWEHLAKLIKPEIDIESLYGWAMENLERYDDPEFTLFNDILCAISRYNRRVLEKDNEQVD